MSECNEKRGLIVVWCADTELLVLTVGSNEYYLLLTTRSFGLFLGSTGAGRSVGNSGG